MPWPTRALCDAHKHAIEERCRAFEANGLIVTWLRLASTPRDHVEEGD